MREKDNIDGNPNSVERPTLGTLLFTKPPKEEPFILEGGATTLWTPEQVADYFKKKLGKHEGNGYPPRISHDIRNNILFYFTDILAILDRKAINKQERLNTMVKIWDLAHTLSLGSLWHYEFYVSLLAAKGPSAGRKNLARIVYSIFNKDAQRNARDYSLVDRTNSIAKSSLQLLEQLRKLNIDSESLPPAVQTLLDPAGLYKKQKKHWEEMSDEEKMKLFIRNASHYIRILHKHISGRKLYVNPQQYYRGSMPLTLKEEYEKGLSPLQ